MTDWVRFGRSVAEKQDRTLANEHGLSEARAKLIATVGAAPVRHSGPRIVAGALAFAAVVAAVLFFALRTSSAPLEIRVGPNGYRADPGSFIAASPNEALPIRFSDGSSVLLAPTSAARVTATGVHGAHVVVESGHVDVAVVHQAATEWHLRAGPFDVAVTGTRFDLEWKTSQGELSVAMKEGRVVVTGGCLARAQELGAGERLVASMVTSRWQVSSGNEVVASSPTDPSTEPAVRDTPPSTSASPEPSAKPLEEKSAPVAGVSSGAADPAGWRAALSRGEYRAAIGMLDEGAWAQALQTSSAADLMALANAARLSDDIDHARQALVAVRRRFPRDGRSSVAAFTLGRLAFDRNHAYADAANWFRRYLSEAPSGDLAREASGRLIEAYQLSGNRSEAMEAARKYLSEYPTGPHADLARHVLATH
jgi:TolA-binding protein